MRLERTQTAQSPHSAAAMPKRMTTRASSPGPPRQKLGQIKVTVLSR
jgi:hypothetical protein